jgi:capsule synthesis protein PGA_cap
MLSTSFIRSRWLVPALLAAAGATSLQLPVAQAQNALSAPPPPKLRDQRLELALKINQPFTLVAVGDMLQMVPISRSNDPDVQFLMELMRNADMTIANNENTIVDKETFTGPISHMETPRIVADDWANMGIKMMTKANNHTWDDGEEGVWADFHELSRVGIVHVGVDRDMTEARLARYAATPKGTVGLIGIYADSSQLFGLPTGRTVTVTDEQLRQLRAIRDSIVARRSEVSNPIVVPPPGPQGQVDVFGVLFKTASAAEAADPATAALAKRVAEHYARMENIKAKANTLRLTTYNGVTREQLKQLAAIAGEPIKGDTLSAFGIEFKVSAKPGEYHYEMNVQDEREILREMRTGKQFSDFAAATIHWHQNRFAYQHYSFDHYPPDYQVKFAHDIIDQGADAFIAHGVHTIKGVEIYKGKPIFYGVSNFVVHEQIFASWRDTGSQPPVSLDGPIVGQGEVNEKQWAWMQHPDNFEALLTSSHYENGKLKEVRIYPVDVGGPDRPGSQLGTPKRPSPAVAQQILEHVVEYSRPFGTKISIEQGVGVIRISADGRSQ